MPKRFVIVITLVFLTIGGFFLWQKIGPSGNSGASLTQRVYVWQRIQNAPVVASAIESVPREVVSGMLPLVAEVHFRNGPDLAPEIVRPSLAVGSFQKRAAGENSDAAVIRIGVSAAETEWNPKACEIVETLAREFLMSPIWATNELQIDYDCPQKRLGEFAKLLSHLKAAFPEKTLTFTALPTWLGESEFAKTAAIADSYVLQVHSLQLPSEPSQPVVLINPDSARAAVERAGQLGHPFEVALPTYSCFVIFEADSDRVLDVVSEDLPRRWPSNVGRVKLGQTDPAAMTQLVREWKKSHPAAMCGLIWYRLPVATDVMNWPPPVWNKVVRGESPVQQSEFEIRREKLRSTIVFKNIGETTVPLPETIELQISGEGEYQFDGGKLYVGEGDPLKFILKKGPVDHLPLPSGKAVEIGWIEGNVTVLVPES
ncbi:MAG: DUF3142 domain-containing protein [Verrucomicrobiales bacterium]